MEEPTYIEAAAANKPIADDEWERIQQSLQRAVGTSVLYRYQLAQVFSEVDRLREENEQMDSLIEQLKG